MLLALAAIIITHRLAKLRLTSEHCDGACCFRHQLGQREQVMCEPVLLLLFALRVPRVLRRRQFHFV